MGVYFKGYEVTPWDISKSYPIGSVVKYDGREYLAKKDVPVGINIGMSDYWDFGDDERLDNLEEAVEELDGAIQNLTLDDLGDVDMSTPEDGDVLVYDGETEAFVNAPASSLTSELSYSTELRRVGTWIDGSNVYQITYDFNGIPSPRTVDLPEKVKDIVNWYGAYKSKQSGNDGYWVDCKKYTSYGINIAYCLVPDSDNPNGYATSFTIDVGSSVNVQYIEKFRVTFLLILDESEE